MTSVVVVGGGISGLAAAHALTRAAEELDVTVVEREPRLGGKILTERHDGLLFEAGPDAFVARDPAILSLCEDLELTDALIAPQAFGARIWSGEEMKELPPDWAFGLPPTVSSLLTSDLLSLDSKLRGLWDFVAPGKLTGDDISIGALIRRRLGAQLLEEVVDPLLAGSRAGTADDISLAAGMAPLDLVARSSASIMRGIARARRAGALPSGPPPFLGIAGGMQRLVERLRDSLGGTTVRTGCAALAIERAPSHGYAVHLEDGSTLAAQGVIVATPAHSAATLVEPLDAVAARELYRIPYASSAVGVLVYPGGREKVPGGSGFLVPSRDRKVLSACTWFSEKWPQAAPADERLVLRAFVGRSGNDASLMLDDDELIGRMDEEARHALDLDEHLTTAKLYRWERGLPHYRVGHPGLVAKIDASLATLPGIELTGAGYRGSGLPDCVRQAQDAATRLLTTLEAHGR